METVIFQSPHPLVPLMHKEGLPRGVSWGGFNFEPDELGINWLPVEAVAEMTESHGMVGVPNATPQAQKANPRDRYIAELEASNERLRARIAELEAPADPAAAKATQTTDGGLVRPLVFPTDGEHPIGGEQPALGPAPIETEVKASQSAPDKSKRRNASAGIDVVS